jgi:hypothetical protein
METRQSFGMYLPSTEPASMVLAGALSWAKHVRTLKSLAAVWSLCGATLLVGVVIIIMQVVPGQSPIASG